MIKLLIKFLIGVVVAPIAVGASIAFYNNLVQVSELSGSLNFFVWGIASYAIMHLVFYKPTYLYVLGHEAVHAGMAWLFGGKVKSIKVSKEGGSVATNKTNTAIELGPYFVPIYAIIIAIVYFIIASSYRINSSVFIFLMGFALAFHVISTIEVMKTRQPDIVKSGYFFSIVMIYVLNILVVSLIFAMLFSSFSEKKFLVDFFVISKKVYGAVLRQLFF